MPELSSLLTGGKADATGSDMEEARRAASDAVLDAVCDRRKLTVEQLAALPDAKLVEYVKHELPPKGRAELNPELLRRMVAEYVGDYGGEGG